MRSSNEEAAGQDARSDNGGADAPGAPAVLAASLILLRPAARPLEPAQHLMMERAATMAFAPGALVFPGGRLEPDDYAIAADRNLVRNVSGVPIEDASAIAAIRETLEEVGIVIGITPQPSPGVLQEWRRDLKAGLPFGALLASSGAVIDLAHLVLFAHWLPKLSESRRFDTRFFVARVDHLQQVEVDPSEAASHHWLTATAAIAAAARGEHRLVFPTERNLERLSAWLDFDEVRRHVADTPIQVITPEIRSIDGEDWLCIPTDAGYPRHSFRLADLRRK